ncbi:hypothetical protein FLK61_37845 [Paenalkalicoccus suaedae]|uniref:Uncharacterized protein n=1 Tax=Paenalkalicoccus suaedae TaxID=2592382 RepID=A0A859FG95_9BACI|nr:hypothetical protein [Paenalkalicoccus suaedae]QKS72393.1 hypothetical protein FLK61_37845 [Paenalkalicoccus suaedae]
MRNEKGYALIVVLIAIVVISLMSVPLVEAALNSSTQAERSEQQVLATDVRDIGIKHMRENIIDVVEGAEVADVATMAELLRTELGNETISLPQNTQVSQTFSVNAPQVNILDDRVVVTYMSNGTVGNVTEEREETLQLRLVGGTPVEETGSGSGIEELWRKVQNSESIFVNASGKYQRNDASLNGDYIFRSNTNIQNGAYVTVTGDAAILSGINLLHDSYLRINGSLYHEGSQRLMSQNPREEAEILVEKDMLLSNVRIQPQARVCVKGSVYQVQNNSFTLLTESNNSGLNKVSSCSDKLTQGKINYEGQTFSDQPGSGTPDEIEGARWVIETIDN